MRKGCISLGKVQCDGCRRTIPYAGRYLLINEVKGAEVEEGGKALRYCADCCLEKGYAKYREEKSERVLTFFPSEPEPLEQDADKELGQVEENG